MPIAQFSPTDKSAEVTVSPDGTVATSAIAGANWRGVRVTKPASGRTYSEFTITQWNGVGSIAICFGTVAVSLDVFLGAQGTAGGAFLQDGTKRQNGAKAAAHAPFGVGSRVGLIINSPARGAALVVNGVQGDTLFIGGTDPLFAAVQFSGLTAPASITWDPNPAVLVPNSVPYDTAPATVTVCKTYEVVPHNVSPVTLFPTVLWEDQFTTLPKEGIDWSYGPKPTNWDGGQYGAAFFTGSAGLDGHQPYTLVPEGLRIRSKYMGETWQHPWGWTFDKPYKKWLSGQIATAKYTNPATGHAVYHGARKGYFEVRMKMPKGSGAWPAFWLINEEAIENKNNNSRELDICEYYGGFPDRYHATTHGWTTNEGYGSPNGFAPMGDGADLSAAFHTFGAIVADTEVIYYFDRREVVRHALPQPEKTDNFWMIVSLAESADWDTVVPPEGYRDLIVDYVRIYTK